MREFFSFFTDILQVFIMALAIFIVANFFLIQPHRVDGSSMEPNFHNSELLLTDKISYRFRLPQRGEVVVFHAWFDPQKRDFIKRIIGLPGDRLKLIDGQIYINDKKLLENFSPQGETVGRKFLKEGEEITLAGDEYFLLGDNRPSSADSRIFGPVKKKYLVGRVLFRYWPLTRISVFNHQPLPLSR